MATDIITADVLFVADHFILVTTVEVIYSPDQRDIEKAAWDRLGAEYGIDWVATTRQFINKVSIEVLEENTITITPNPTINDVMKALAEEEPSDERTTS
jgi:hypothetical protein